MNTILSNKVPPTNQTTSVHQNFKRCVYFVKSYPISPIQCILPVENNCRPFSFLHRLTLRWKVKESLHLLNWIFEVTETALVRIVIKLSVTLCFWNFSKIVVFSDIIFLVLFKLKLNEQWFHFNFVGQKFSPRGQLVRNSTASRCNWTSWPPNWIL